MRVNTRYMKLHQRLYMGNKHKLWLQIPNLTGYATKLGLVKYFETGEVGGGRRTSTANQHQTYNGKTASCLASVYKDVDLSALKKKKCKY